MSDVAYAPDPSSAGADTAASKDIAGVTNVDTKAITGKLADIDKERIGAIDRSERQSAGALAQINKIGQAQIHATGVMAEKLKPWDEEAETAKHRTDPIVAFGSLGSVLGILASAFTHAPMENALNASASAMNAIRANDDKMYERAHTAWQDNMSLAVKRFNLEQTGYKDAVELMKTNMAAGSEKLKMEMMKYGWEQGLVLHEAGLDDKLFEAIEARGKAVASMGDIQQKIVHNNAYMSDAHRLGFDSTNPTSAKSIEAIRKADERWNDKNQTPENKIYTDYATTPKEDGSYPTVDEREAFRAKQKQADRVAAGGNLKSQIIREHAAALQQADPSLSNADALDQATMAYDQAHPAKTKETVTDKSVKLGVEEWKKEHPGQEIPKAEYDKIVQNAAKPQTTKQFSAQESARLTYTPTLVRSLQVLDSMMDDSTGLFTGSMKQFAAEYIGVNNPVQLWQAAKKEADAAITALAPTGSKSVVALKAQLDTLPETPRSSAFGHTQVADKLRSILDESQSALSAMEAGGKKLPQDVLDKFAKLGVTIKSDADKNPIAKLNANPQTLTDEELKNLAGLRMAYPKDVQDKIIAEVKRRAADWERSHQKHSSLTTNTVVSDAGPYPIQAGQQYAMDETINKGPRSMETQGLQPGGFGGGGAASYRSSPWQPPQVKAELEGVLTDYATGKISSREVQKEFKKRGWSVELRGNKSEAQAFDPNGFGHWLSF